MEQQNMMDFSKNIKINEELDKNNNDNLYKKQYNNFIINEEIEKENNNKGIEIDKKYDNKQNKLKEEEDREPYKKIFKIAEYLYYYQNKVDNNYFHIINNEIKDESRKSTISKISNNVNINSSLYYLYLYIFKKFKFKN